jgi:hypothetical protein
VAKKGDGFGSFSDGGNVTSSTAKKFAGNVMRKSEGSFDITHGQKGTGVSRESTLKTKDFAAGTRSAIGAGGEHKVHSRIWADQGGTTGAAAEFGKHASDTPAKATAARGAAVDGAPAALKTGDRSKRFVNPGQVKGGKI